MHSAQPSLGDLEERLIAKFKELQTQFQESIAVLVSKTVSDSVSSQVCFFRIYIFLFIIELFICFRCRL